MHNSPENLVDKACTVPCPDCEVAELPLNQRLAVDMVFERDERYHQGSIRRGGLAAEVLVTRAAQALQETTQSHDVSAAGLVAQAATRIIENKCPTYNEND